MNVNLITFLACVHDADVERKSTYKTAWIRRLAEKLLIRHPPYRITRV
jgi:hypothetical protein